MRPAAADETVAPILFLLFDAASFVSGACVGASGVGFTLGGTTCPEDVPET